MRPGIIAVVIGLVLVGIFLVFALVGSGNNAEENVGGTESFVPVPGAEDVEEMIVNTGSEGSVEQVVEITSSGFSPRTLEISQGDTVTWTNNAGRSVWPASAIHPTHSVYPESGGCIGSAFDACRGLEPGETYSFTFNEIGSWGYHDHLRASVTGTVVVN